MPHLRAPCRTCLPHTSLLPAELPARLPHACRTCLPTQLPSTRKPRLAPRQLGRPRPTCLAPAAHFGRATLRLPHTRSAPAAPSADLPAHSARQMRPCRPACLTTKLAAVLASARRPRTLSGPTSATCRTPRGQLARGLGLPCPRTPTTKLPCLARVHPRPSCPAYLVSARTRSGFQPCLGPWPIEHCPNCLGHTWSNSSDFV